MLQACSKHYRPNRLGRVLFMGARGRFAFGRSRPRPSVRKGCLRLAQSGRREAGSMAAPAGKLTTTAPFFIGGILRRNPEVRVASVQPGDSVQIVSLPATTSALYTAIGQIVAVVKPSASALPVIYWRASYRPPEGLGGKPRWRAVRWRRSTGNMTPRKSGLTGGLPRVTA